MGKELTSQFFPPGKELTSQFFPREKTGRPILSPGKKLTGEKTDRHTGPRGIVNKQPRKYQLSNLKVSDFSKSVVKDKKLKVHNSHPGAIKYRKSGHFLKIAKNCQTMTLVCFNIFKEPIQFWKREINNCQYKLTVTNQRYIT